MLLLRRGLLALGLALSALSLHAAPPVQNTQVPGYYRHATGDFEVTALYDGFVDLGVPLLKGLRADQIQSLLARMFINSSQGVQTAVNAYLVNTGAHLVLVDAGAASCFGPSLGQVQDNIRAAGYQPEQVDAVLLTHLHPDHLCGVLDKNGQAAFPQATLWAAQQDIDFWLDDKTAQAAPAENQPFFRMAMDAVRPYQSAGRLRSFKAGDTLLPGVSVVGTPGHTPGHSSYLFSSGTQQLLVWGDIVHSHAVQFRHPEVSLEFDVNQPQAIATRKALFQRASEAGWAIAGAHLPFPGLGHVRKDPQGYAWVPVEFGPIRGDR